MSALRGIARVFCRSCSPVQKNSYQSLVTELKKRFTPVQLTAVQTQLFHSRQQGAKESVDDFAQELRKLHSRAYSAATYAYPKAEKVGQMVLANQFISGLRPKLQPKIVGMEASMDTLILKARFEEAKARELAGTRMSLWKKSTNTTTTNASGSDSQLERASFTITTRTTAAATSGPKEDNRSRLGPSQKCLNCGLEGHMARNCPYPKPPRAEQEAHGHPHVSNVTMEPLVGGKRRKPRKSRISHLRRKFRQAELEDVLEEEKGTLSVVQTEEGKSVCVLGPTVYVLITVEGVRAKALVDTGSPATIISLQFVLKVFSTQCTPRQTVNQWKQEVYQKFTIPSISLQNYGGHGLDILAQTELNLSTGDRHV